MIIKNNKPDIIKRRLVFQHVGDHGARAQTNRRQTDAPQTTRPKKISTEATRKSTRKRPATLASALGNPIPMNIVEQKKFGIELPGKHVVPKENQPSSLSSFIHEMDFRENSPEFIAYIHFLITITPCAPRAAQDAVKVVDLVSPTNIQTNETITMDKKNVGVPEKPSTTVTEEKANTTEEHKKQVDEEVNDDMIIDTKKSNNATEQPTKELQEPAKGN